MAKNGSMVAFEFIKPECVALCRNRDIDSIKKLQVKIEVVPSEDLNEILQYLLFPFRVILKESQNIKDDMLIATSECLNLVFCKCIITEWKVFEDIFLIMCFKLNTVFDKTSSREDKMFNVITCIGSLVGNAASHVGNNFYNIKNLPLLGRAVHLILSTLKETEARHLKVACLNCLKEICHPSYLKNLDESSQHMLKCKIGNLVASFLPGISTAVAAIVPSNINLGGKIKCACLQLLASLLTVALGDKYLEQTGGTKDLDDNLKSICVIRNESWVNSTSTKLQPIFNTISSAATSSEWKVRLECLTFFETMLTECQNTLKTCTNIFIATPVKLLNDEYTEISNEAARIMGHFSLRVHGTSTTDQEYIIEIFKNNLLTLCSDLPIILRKSTDEEKISKLSLILGYATLLKEKIEFLYVLPIFQKKLNQALLDCLEIDSSSINVMEYVHVQDETTAINTPKIKLRYVHFKENRVLYYITKLCHYLGQYTVLDTTSDYFIDVYISSSSLCKQAILVLNELLVGAKNNNLQDLNSHVSNLLNILVLPENWNLTTSINSSYNNHHFQKPSKLMLTHGNLKTNNNINHNIILVCLQIEAIFVFSEVLKLNFREHLNVALYPLLEKCCDENPVVAARAKNVLQGVAINCEYQGIHDLISNNADYVISTISIQLINLSVFPRCPSALKAVLDLCDERVLPLVRDTIDEILLSLDLHHFNDDKLMLFLPVLASILNSLIKFSRKKEFKDHDELRQEAADNKETLLQFIHNYHKQHEIASLKQDPKIEEQESENQNSETTYDSDDLIEKQIGDEKENVPAEVKISEQVLLRCKNLISHWSPKVRICVLDIVGNGLIVLSAHENSLLPMAHKLWAPLLPRLSDSEVQVVIKAFETVCVLSELCGQFLRKRICKDVLYKILDFLKFQIKIRSDNEPFLSVSTTHVGQKQTMAFKMQRTVLNKLGPLLVSADVSTNDVQRTCDTCYKYLSIKQPVELQGAAIVLFKHMIEIDKDVVWLFLMDICCTENLTPPEVPCEIDSFKFDDIKMRGDTDKNNVYYKNISILVKLC